MSPCQSKLFFNPQFAAIQYVIACVGNSNSSSKHSATVLINKPNSHCGWKGEKQSEKEIMEKWDEPSVYECQT